MRVPIAPTTRETPLRAGVGHLPSHPLAFSQRSLPCSPKDMLKNLINYCFSFLDNTFLTWSILKVGCTAGITILFAFLGNSTGEYIILAGLILIDFLMALLVLTRTGGRFRSSGVWRLAEKWFISFLLLMGMQISEPSLHLPFAAEVTAAAMIAAQLVSILEHVGTLGMVIPIPLLKTLKKMSEGEQPPKP